MAFQASQKPKRGIGEEKGEHPSANGRQGSGLYQGSPENSLRNHSHCFFSRHGHSRRDNTKGGAKGWREVSGDQISLLETGYINGLWGLVSGAFAFLNLDTGVP